MVIKVQIESSGKPIQLEFEADVEEMERSVEVWGRLIERLIGKPAQRETTPSETISPKPSSINNEVPTSTLERQLPEKPTILDFAIRAYERLGKDAVTHHELAKQMEDEGWRTESDSPPAVVRATLASLNSPFRRREDGSWTLPVDYRDFGHQQPLDDRVVGRAHQVSPHASRTDTSRRKSNRVRLPQSRTNELINTVLANATEPLTAKGVFDSACTMEPNIKPTSVRVGLKQALDDGKVVRDEEGRYSLRRSDCMQSEPEPESEQQEGVNEQGQKGGSLFAASERFSQGLAITP